MMIQNEWKINSDNFEIILNCFKRLFWNKIWYRFKNQISLQLYKVCRISLQGLISLLSSFIKNQGKKYMASLRNNLPSISWPKKSLKADNQIKSNNIGFHLSLIKRSRWSRIDKTANSDHLEIIFNWFNWLIYNTKISLQKSNLASTSFGLYNISSGSYLASKLVGQ